MHCKSNNGSSHQRCSIKKLLIFKEKHLCSSFFLLKFQVWKSATLLKETPTHIFTCEYCEIFEHLFWRTSANGCFSITAFYMTCNTALKWVELPRFFHLRQTGKILEYDHENYYDKYTEKIPYKFGALSFFKKLWWFCSSQ